MNQAITENSGLPDGQVRGKSRLNGGQTRILVVPLDWGLGHATRCIPVIKELIRQGCEVWLAGEGAQAQLLKTEFPDLTILPLAGYRVRFSKTKKGLLWRLLQQSPKLKLAIRFEHKWLKQTVEHYKIDAVISDNRYGLSHPSIPSIFITHQLRIKSPAGQWTEKILQKSNYKYINRFSECWVPDLAGTNNLAGELSHPALMPAIPLHYIGLLSRFDKKETRATPKSNHLLVILSGPEPQRSMLEEKIINEISHYNGTATIVRGLPVSPSYIPFTDMIKVYNHLPAQELAVAMQEAAYVICRSGYSSVMDIMALQKKSILIPTPGQTEQEYLATELMNKRFALSYPQTAFSLHKAVQDAAAFDYVLPSFEAGNTVQERITRFLQSLRPEEKFTA